MLACCPERKITRYVSTVFSEPIHGSAHHSCHCIQQMFAEEPIIYQATGVCAAALCNQTVALTNGSSPGMHIALITHPTGKHSWATVILFHDILDPMHQVGLNCKMRHYTAELYHRNFTNSKLQISSPESTQHSFPEQTKKKCPSMILGHLFTQDTRKKHLCTVVFAQK